MVVQEATSPVAEAPEAASPSTGLSPLSWPLAPAILGLLFLLTYAPVLSDVARSWFTDEQNSHGIYIFPIVGVLLWLERDRIRSARRSPVAIGLAVLAAGLALELVTHLLRLKYIGMFSLVVALAGAVLALHGKELWRIVAFPVLFLLAASPLPAAIYGRPSAIIQRISTTGAAQTMQTLGYTLKQSGNYITIPNVDLEVADVCSGFKKLVALVAFSLLFGYLFRVSPGKRALIVLMAAPIAAVANIIRICILIAVSTHWGKPALDLMHTPAEFIVLGVALALFLLTGKLLGCNTTRYSPPQPS